MAAQMVYSEQTSPIGEGVVINKKKKKKDLTSFVIMSARKHRTRREERGNEGDKTRN